MRSLAAYRVIGRSRERGLAAVEFAMLLPLMLLIMLATAELGRALFQYNTLTKAVRDGARHLSSVAIGDATETISLDGDKLTDTRNLVIYGNTAGTGTPLLPGLTPGQLVITAPDALHVRVQAAYPYQSIFSTLPGFGLMTDIGMSWTLTSAITMRAL